MRDACLAAQSNQGISQRQLPGCGFWRAPTVEEGINPCLSMSSSGVFPYRRLCAAIGLTTFGLLPHNSVKRCTRQCSSRKPRPEKRHGESNQFLLVASISSPAALWCYPWTSTRARENSAACHPDELRDVMRCGRTRAVLISSGVKGLAGACSA